MQLFKLLKKQQIKARKLRNEKFSGLNPAKNTVLWKQL